MSLYDRLDLTRPTRKLKVPIWERIDLTRPPKLRCQGCRSPIQPQWEFCPSCGQNLIEKNSEIRRCIWVDVAGMDVASENKEAIAAILIDAFR